MKSRFIASLLLLLTAFPVFASDQPSMIMAAVHKKHQGGWSAQDRLMLNDDPNAYIFGQITKADIFKYKDELITVIAVQPFMQSQIFEVSLAFCGNNADQLRGMTGLVIVTYVKRHTRTNCTDLVDIRQSLNESKEIQ